MSLAQLIQNAWNKQLSWLIVLRPLSCLYRAGFLLNRYLYSSGFKSLYRTCASPGNWQYYGGGSGKRHY